VEERGQDEPDAGSGGDRPPAAVSEDTGEAAGMTEREDALEELLADEDPDQRGGAGQPEPTETHAEPDGSGVMREGPAERDEEAAGGYRDQGDHPRHQRMQVRVAGLTELDARSPTVGEQVTELVDGEGGGRQ
jgi:hypothetical protein